MGNQFLFKSTDDGDHWQKISPDLSGKIAGAKDYTYPDQTQARAAGYGVIFSIAPSPVSEGVIWVGTDDGLIQLTTDGGKHWKNVTPSTVPMWARVDAIDPSPFSIHAAYVAMNTHRLGYSKPLILKTTNDGRTWQTITNGILADEFVNVVRTDPVKKGLLYAGTNRSVYVSFDDGENWQPLTLNFPTTCVNDLVVHDGDLVAGTQGRAIWILDDVEPLRETTAKLASESVHLFHLADAWRVRADENKDTPWPPETALGQNPPTGAIVDYWLKDNVQGPVTLTIRDSKGNIVRKFSSQEEQENLPAHRYFQKGWIHPEEQLAATAGMHRFVWGLRYPRPSALRYEYSIAAVWTEGTPLDPEGPLVLPGKYTAALTVAGKDYSQPFVVKLDPRVHVSENALQAQLKLAKSIDAAIEQAVSAHNTINDVLKEKKGSIPTATADTLFALADRGQPSLASVAGVLTGLETAVQGADAAPAQGESDVYSHYRKELDGLLARWHAVEASMTKSGK